MKNFTPPRQYRPSGTRRPARMLTALMLLLGSPALAQPQTVPSAAAPGPGPVSPPPTIAASQTTLCQGGSAVLAATPGTGGGTPTYTWSPNTDLSSTSDAKVLVNPLKTTTYTVAIFDGTTTTRQSITITVKTNCCQQTAAPKIVELKSVYKYNGALPFGNDPFRQYPPGTYFHVAGPSLTLNNTEFVLPAGSVLLMDAGADVILDDARLILKGGTITAACDEMWGQLLQTSNHGVRAEAVGSLRPRLLHSKGGLVLQDQDGTNFHLQLANMDFLHNYRSLSLQFERSPANSADYVTNCSFDSDPALMKAPHKPSLSGADYSYTLEHVLVRGNVGDLTFVDNTLTHALLGVSLAPSSVATTLSLARCQFSDIYLAGVFSYDLTPFVGSLVRVDASRFRFPLGAALPATTQATSLQYTYGSFLQANETVGLSTLFLPLSVTGGTVFEQPDTSPYATFKYTDYRPRQVGITSRRVGQVLDNTFTGLSAGIAHYLNNGYTDTEVRGNLFRECTMGYEFMPVVTPAPTQPTGTAYLSCNTFERGVSLSQRSGVSYGIFNEDGAYVTLANPLASINNPTIQKNRFDDAGAGVSGFYALYNANNSQPLSYYTFKNYSGQILPIVNAPQVQLPGSTTLGTPDYTGTNIDCAPLTPNGLPRAAISSPSTAVLLPVQLEQNVPNPAAGTTRIAYRVPTTAHEATLFVRRAMDGKIVVAVPVSTNGRYHDLKLAAYPADLYLYSLVVDGVPSLTRRLVIQ